MNKLDGLRQFDNLLGMIILFTHLPVQAQGGATQITSEISRIPGNHVKEVVRSEVSSNVEYFTAPVYLLHLTRRGEIVSD